MLLEDISLTDNIDSKKSMGIERFYEEKDYKEALDLEREALKLSTL